MNNVLVYADLQATEGSERLRGDPAVPLQRWRVNRLYQDLATLYRRHGCKYLIDLGDTTDDRESLPIPTVQAVMQGLSRINPDPLLSIKLIGNHEQTLKSQALNPGLIYRSFHRVIEDREIFRVKNTAIIAVAWPNEDINEWLAEAIAAAQDEGCKVLLLGHLAINGAIPIKGDVGLPNRPDLTLLGHVHTPCCPLDNVYYVGSPFQQDFSEMGQTKRVGLLDLDTLDLKWLPLPSSYPRYLRLSFHEFQQYKSLGEDRIAVSIKSQAEAEAFHAHPLSPLVDPEYEIAPRAVALSHEAYEAATIEDLLKAYVKKKPLPGFSEDELGEFGRAILA